MTPTTPGTDAKDEAPNEITIAALVSRAKLHESYDHSNAAIDRLATAARQAAALKAENQELRAALEKRERQLCLAVAGMSQGKDSCVFVALDWAGDIVDVVMKQAESTDNPPKVRRLAAAPSPEREEKR